MDCLHVFSLVATLRVFGGVKVQTVLSCLFTISATLTFSCNHRNTVHLSLSLSHPVSLSVFLIGVQHPPTSCQERAPLWSSEPANYCLGRRMPRGPSQTPRTSRRALPAAQWQGGQNGSNVRGWPPPHPPVLCCAFILMDLTNTKQLKATRSQGEV